MDLTVRSMSNNIVISGITGDGSEEKDCKSKVLEFFRNKMKMEVADTEVEVAHRIGKLVVGRKPRLMVVRCIFALKERVFEYTKNLKDLENDLGDYYSVKSPEPLLSERNYQEERMRSIRKSNAAIPEDQKERKVPVAIKNKVLYIKNIP